MVFYVGSLLSHGHVMIYFLPFWGHLGCFQFFAEVNVTWMNILVYKSLSASLVILS